VPLLFRKARLQHAGAVVDEARAEVVAARAEAKFHKHLQRHRRISLLIVVFRLFSNRPPTP
jgi:hypothetical protein